MQYDWGIITIGLKLYNDAAQSLVAMPGIPHSHLFSHWCNSYKSFLSCPHHLAINLGIYLCWQMVCPARSVHIMLLQAAQQTHLNKSCGYQPSNTHITTTTKPQIGNCLFVVTVWWCLLCHRWFLGNSWPFRMDRIWEQIRSGKRFGHEFQIPKIHGAFAVNLKWCCGWFPGFAVVSWYIVLHLEQSCSICTTFGTFVIKSKLKLWQDHIVTTARHFL